MPGFHLAEAIWPAIVIPAGLAFLVVVIRLTAPRVVLRLIPRAHWMPITIGYAFLSIFGAILLMALSAFLEMSVNASRASEAEPCFPIMEQAGALGWTLAWALVVLPAILLSPIALFYVANFMTRRATRRARANTARS